MATRSGGRTLESLEEQQFTSTLGFSAIRLRNGVCRSNGVTADLANVG